jgi:hypothetical protein
MALPSINKAGHKQPGSGSKTFVAIGLSKLHDRREDRTGPGRIRTTSGAGIAILTGHDWPQKRRFGWDCDMVRCGARPRCTETAGTPVDIVAFLGSIGSATGDRQRYIWSWHLNEA